MAGQLCSVMGKGSVWSFSESWRRFLGLTLLCHSPYIFISACIKWLWNSSKEEFSFFLSGSSTFPVHRYKCLERVPRKTSDINIYCYLQKKKKTGQKPFPKSCEINSGEFCPFTSKVQPPVLLLFFCTVKAFLTSWSWTHLSVRQRTYISITSLQELELGWKLILINRWTC